MHMTTQQMDRAAGVLLGQAVGDALGVPYEFGLPPTGEPEMKGGGLGPYAPGEWSDDTQMALCIAEVAATGVDLTLPQALDAVAENFERWYAAGATDVGNQTRSVLESARRREGSPADRLRAASRALAATGRPAAGNGALMRTGVVGLTKLDDRVGTAAAARAIAELTHADPLAIESCVLWSEAVRVAVTTGTLDLVSGLDLLPQDRGHEWSELLRQASTSEPRRFNPNGFTVSALQCAWAAIVSTDDGSGVPTHLQRALTVAVQSGNDTDTVAAIAGTLLGARYGASAVPFRWRRRVHGWPGLRSRDLIGLAMRTATHDSLPGRGWPFASTMRYGYERPCALRHPFDDGVILGTFADLLNAPQLSVDAVVSLSRVGTEDLIAAGVAPQDHVEVWLLDSDDPGDNAHLDFVLDDAADAVAAFRAEGKTVLVQCVAAQQRTPSVAVRYAARLGVPVGQAASAIAAALPDVRGYGLLWDTAARFTSRTTRHSEERA